MHRVVPLLLFFVLWVPAAHAWTWPVPGPVVQGFSFDRAHPYAGGKHRGIDVGAAAGTTVVAPASGTVSFAGSVPASGLTVTIDTADGLAVTLTHLATAAVAKGAAVSEGDAIGTVGPSGTPEVDVPYVHLGIRTISDANGYLDPLAYLPVEAAAPTRPDGASADTSEGSPADSSPPAETPPSADATAQTDSTPAGTAPAETTPAETTPSETASGESAPTETAPAAAGGTRAQPSASSSTDAGAPPPAEEAQSLAEPPSEARSAPEAAAPAPPHDVPVSTPAQQPLAPDHAVAPSAGPDPLAAGPAQAASAPGQVAESVRVRAGRPEAPRAAATLQRARAAILPSRSRPARPAFRTTPTAHAGSAPGAAAPPGPRRAEPSRPAAASPRGSGGAGLEWTLVASGLGLLSVLGAAGVLLSRRRPHPLPVPGDGGLVVPLRPRAVEKDDGDRLAA